MYFYTYKITNNENEQAQLLEMCCNACLHFGNGKDVYSIATYTYCIEKLRKITSATFLFND